MHCRCDCNDLSIISFFFGIKCGQSDRCDVINLVNIGSTGHRKILGTIKHTGSNVRVQVFSSYSATVSKYRFPKGQCDMLTCHQQLWTPPIFNCFPSLVATYSTLATSITLTECNVTRWLTATRSSLDMVSAYYWIQQVSCLAIEIFLM